GLRVGEPHAGSVLFVCLRQVRLSAGGVGAVEARPQVRIVTEGLVPRPSAAAERVLLWRVEHLALLPRDRAALLVGDDGLPGERHGAADPVGSVPGHGDAPRALCHASQGNVAVTRPVASALLLAVALAACSSSAGLAALPSGTLTIGTGGATVAIAVQIARTAEQRERGLMGRRSLAPDAGMVFLEDGPTDATFWMRDTLIPLSIAFWGADGRIVDILDMAPCTADPCPVYRSSAAYVGAVEVNRGF